MSEPIASFEAPYPLQSLFKKFIVPGLIFLVVVIGTIMGTGSSWLTKKIYLQISENRASTIHRALNDGNREAWNDLQVSQNPLETFKTASGRKLLSSLRSEVQELGLTHLKIYGARGLLIYSSEEMQIGQYDPSKGYNDALHGTRSLTDKQLKDGTKLYELYVKVPENPNNIVMELYEPIGYLDAIMSQVVIPATLIPIFALISIGWAMGILVNRAQTDINTRTTLLSEFRQKLQSLVSTEAVETLRTSAGKGRIESKRVKATILFSDIRGFTDFCEQEEPENVVSFLNHSLGIVIDSVRAHEGDVDKMIGDAVLAHFQGKNAEQRALQAAFSALQNAAKANLPRGIGIGIYTGDVVIGTVGASDRMDFTVIGDTVNVAARLCAAAKVGEVLVDKASAKDIAEPHSLEEESLMVKGKSKPIKVLRLHPRTDDI